MRRQVLLVAVLAMLSSSCPVWADDSPLWQKMLQSAQLAYDAGKYSKAARNWTKVVDMLKQAAENTKDQIMLAGCLKHLGDCHRLRQRWLEAGTCYQDSLSAYTKLTTGEPEIAAGLADLSSCYKFIGVESLGAEASKLLKKAGAVCLSSFKTDGGDHFELALAEPYTEVVNEDRIEQVRFNKRICFDFVQTPEGKLTVSKIKGIDVKADVCWVEPRTTIMYLDEKGETTAEVTVNAMGFEKTVTISQPRQVYDYIVEMVKQVNQPVVASGSAPASQPPVTTVPASATDAGVVQTTAVDGQLVPATGGDTTDSSGSSLDCGAKAPSLEMTTAVDGGNSNEVVNSGDQESVSK